MALQIYAGQIYKQVDLRPRPTNRSSAEVPPRPQGMEVHLYYQDQYPEVSETDGNFDRMLSDSVQQSQML